MFKIALHVGNKMEHRANYLQKILNYNYFSRYTSDKKVCVVYVYKKRKQFLQNTQDIQL